MFVSELFNWLIAVMEVVFKTVIIVKRGSILAWGVTAYKVEFRALFCFNELLQITIQYKLPQAPDANGPCYGS